MTVPEALADIMGRLNTLQQQVNQLGRRNGDGNPKAK
jgi:hypothetical protein